MNDVGLIPGKLPRLQLSGQQVKEEETGYELAETKARPCYPNGAYDQSQLELIGASLLSLVAQELGMRIPVCIEGWAILEREHRDFIWQRWRLPCFHGSNQSYSMD